MTLYIPGGALSLRCIIYRRAAYQGLIVNSSETYGSERYAFEAYGSEWEPLEISNFERVVFEAYGSEWEPLESYLPRQRYEIYNYFYYYYIFLAVPAAPR